MVLVVGALTAGAPIRRQPAPRHGARIHWADRASLSSPGRRWSLQVDPPASAAEEDSGATLVVHGEGKSWPIWWLARDGVVFWSPDGQMLLLQDERFADRNQLALFRLSLRADAAGGRVASPLALDRLVRAAVERAVPARDTILSYLPQYVAWRRGSALVLSVGVVTYRRIPGPTVDHCYGVQVNPSAGRIDAVLSEVELHRRYRAGCRTS